MRMRGGMRAELDPCCLHVLDLARVEQRLLHLGCVPQVGLPYALCHEKDRRREPVLAQQGERDRAGRAVAVVEGEDDGPARQPPLTAAVGEVIRKTDTGVAVAREVRELRRELLGGNVKLRVARAWRDAVDLVVHENRQLHTSTLAHAGRSHRSRTVMSRATLARCPLGPRTTSSMRYGPGDRPERSSASALPAMDPWRSGTSRHSSRTEARRPASRSDPAALPSHPVRTGCTVTSVVTTSPESSPAISQNRPRRERASTTVEPRT